MRNYEVIIAGAGPAGCAAALELSNLDPNLAGRVLLLDKAVFPRPKLCAGGVSADAESVLRRLRVDIDLPAVPVNETRFILPTGCLTFQQRTHFRVVRREQFDHCLFQSARDRGVVTQDGEAVEDVIHTPDGVIVQTSKGEYWAKMLVAADGANSTIRGKLGLSRAGRLMVAMELHAPLADASIPNFVSNMAILDLSLLSSGVPGYCWIFPTVSEGPTVISLGIMAAPFGGGGAAPLKSVFASWLGGFELDLNAFEVKAHPALRYEPKAACSRRRVLFVGDAAGIDPLFGEGIASALALGVIAAKSAYDALCDGDYSFSDYEERIRSSYIGSMMRRRRMIARRLYSMPKLAMFFLRHGTLLRGIALLRAPKSGAKITWEPA
jgi:geranylgeranyl reductase family protein